MSFAIVSLLLNVFSSTLISHGTSKIVKEMNMLNFYTVHVLSNLDFICFRININNLSACFL